MKRGLFVLLVASHGVVAGLAGVGVWSWRASFSPEPPDQVLRGRIAKAMDGRFSPHGYAAPDFERDVSALSHARRGPLGDVLRLVHALHAAEPGNTKSFALAAKLCERLGWPACDEASLVQIRKATVR